MTAVKKGLATEAIQLLRDFSPFSRTESYADLLRSERARPVRFGALGAVTFVVNLGLLWAFVEVGIPDVPAYAVALALAVQFNFAISQFWVWGDRHASSLWDRAMAERWMTFHGCIAVSLVVNFVAFAAAQLVMPALLAAIVGVAASTLVKFLSLDRLAFKDRMAADPSPTPPR